MTTVFKVSLALVAVALAAGSASAQRIENNDKSLTYLGTWTQTNDPNASSGSLSVSSTVGSSVSFTVTGTNFVLYRKLDPNGGYATITVDGANFGYVTFYSAQSVSQIPAVIDELSNGTHTIVLTVSAAPFYINGTVGNNVYIDSLQSPAPATYSPTQAQQDAITRVNFYRNLMGIPPARHHLALGLAAMAHAKYLSDTDFIDNNGDPHVETLGASPDFTAPQPEDRDAYFGYTGQAAGAEDSNNNPDPITFVDGWMDGVDHRDMFVNWGLTDGGFGGYPLGSTMDMAPNVANPASPATTTVFTYPASGQTDVWLFYDGTDGPDGANLNFGGAYGYPITLSVAVGANFTMGTSMAQLTGTLTDSNGNNIPVTLSGPPQGQPGNFYMIPNQPLTVSTTYTATMSGADFTGNAFTKTWSFTAANPNSVHKVRPGNHDSTKTFLYNFLWNMTGTTIPSQLEYGPTTAYGTVVPGTFYGPPAIYYANIVGLAATTGVIHYRVTATDAQGNKYASPDHTISVANPVAPATVGYIAAQSYTPGTEQLNWETAGPVSSTQVNYGLTTAYGSPAAGTAQMGGVPTQFSVTLTGLTTGSTYHYQITATDMQGNTLTSPDATFVAQ